MADIRLGIDFGTSNTTGVLHRPDLPAEALLFEGSPLLPSAVHAGADGGLHVGVDALHAARSDPAGFEPHPKRRVDDGSMLLGGHDYPVEDIFAAVLAKVAQRCREVAGTGGAAVTVTHPAYWGATRRERLRTAAERAGMPGARLVPEPVAAAAFYLHRAGQSVPDGGVMVVFDFGAGTLDVTAVRRDGGELTVLAVDGLADVGGVDVDEAVVQHLRATQPDPETWARLLAPETAGDRRQARLFREDVRLAKERLSRQSRTDLHIPLLDRDVHLTRAELEALTAPLLERAVDTTRAVIGAAGLEPGEVSAVFLVGGAARMPLVATMLHRALGRAPVLTDQVEQAVAHGAILVPAEAAAPSEPAAVVAAPHEDGPVEPVDVRRAGTRTEASRKAARGAWITIAFTLFGTAFMLTGTIAGIGAGSISGVAGFGLFTVLFVIWLLAGVSQLRDARRGKSWRYRVRVGPSSLLIAQGDRVQSWSRADLLTADLLDKRTPLLRLRTVPGKGGLIRVPLHDLPPIDKERLRTALAAFRERPPGA